MSSAIGVARVMDFAKISAFGWRVGAIGSVLHGIDRRKTMIDRPLAWMRVNVSRFNATPRRVQEFPCRNTIRRFDLVAFGQASARPCPILACRI